MERITPIIKIELIDLFLQRARELAAARGYCPPDLTALGLLLNRTPLYAGSENVVPAVHVEHAFATLSDLDWTEPGLAEIETLFLRAGRIADNPSVDLPKTLREKIAFKLEKSGFASARLRKLRIFVPIAGADRASLFGESLPPGLLIADQ